MGDVKHLNDKEAVLKITDLAKEIKTCMFCTYKGNRLHSRPMSVQQVDDEGNIWFLSDKSSNKNQEIAAIDTVELLFGQGHEKYLALHGTASISYDKEKIKELWEPIVKVWMPGGVDDPALSVIKVAVSEGYYWDIKHGKMVEIAKMAASLVTGTTMDDGIEGKLRK